EQRRQVLREACAVAGIHNLFVYGNAWTCDYLRYATGFAPLEGHALAMLTPDRVQLLLEARSEVRRARVEAPGLDVHWAADFHREAQALIAGATGVGHVSAAHIPAGVMAALDGS